MLEILIKRKELELVANGNGAEQQIDGRPRYSRRATGVEQCGSFFEVGRDDWLIGKASHVFAEKMELRLVANSGEKFLAYWANDPGAALLDQFRRSVAHSGVTRRFARFTTAEECGPDKKRASRARFILLP